MAGSTCHRSIVATCVVSLPTSSILHLPSPFLRVRGRLVIHHPPVEQMDRAVRVRFVARVVRHHANRGAISVKFAQKLHHALAVHRIEVTRRIVGQKDGRIAGHRALMLNTIALRRRLPPRFR